MIRAFLIVVVLAFPLGVFADGASSERPERGNVTHIDVEGGHLELNGVSYKVPPGVGALSKVEMGSMVVVHFTRVGGVKMVNDLIVEEEDD